MVIQEFVETEKIPTEELKEIANQHDMASLRGISAGDRELMKNAAEWATN
jgi:hypothetical protein